MFIRVNYQSANEQGVHPLEVDVLNHSLLKSTEKVGGG